MALLDHRRAPGGDEREMRYDRQPVTSGEDAPAFSVEGVDARASLKSAVTALLSFNVKEQMEALPAQAPLQPTKVEPGIGVAISSTLVSGT
jgi:hypothetical protein